MEIAVTEYIIRINRSQGSLEVIAPERDWVDAQIEQLIPVLERTPPAEEPFKDPPPRKNKKRSASSTRTDETKRSKPRATSGKPQINDALRDELASRKDKLKTYIDARRKQWDGSQSAQAAIIATFLQDELDQPGVDHHDLYTVYTVMGERSPGNIRSQLVNARQRARYFASVTDGKAVLSHAGENFARLDSLDDHDVDAVDSA